MSLAMQKRNNVSTKRKKKLKISTKCEKRYNFIGKTFTMIPKLGLFQIRLPPEVNRVLYIRNLPYKITSDEMYDIFGKYGAIRQIRV